MPVDLSTLTDEEVATLRDQCNVEVDRRRVLSHAPEQAAALSASFLTAAGRVYGAAWVQPTGAHDAYPLGHKVTFNGKTYESLIPANVWAPGLDARWWKDLTTVPAPGAWSGASVAYKVGDRVTFNGSSYDCLQAHTSQAGWTPAAVPALWKKV